MELPELSAEFAGEARKRIVDAEVKASRAFGNSKPVLRVFPAASFPTPPTEDWQLLHEYILPVFAIFAEEACALGRHPTNPWFSDRIDREVREYLGELMAAAEYEYRRRSNRRISGMISGGVVHADVWCEIEKSAEWTAYQDLLLAVGMPCDSAGISQPVPSQASPSSPAAGPTLTNDGRTASGHPVSLDDLIAKRNGLLAEYRAATGNPSNRRLYTAKNSGIHKPQFYEWLKGTLADSSGTTTNFERFLRDMKPPIPRKPKR